MSEGQPSEPAPQSLSKVAAGYFKTAEIIPMDEVRRRADANRIRRIQEHQLGQLGRERSYDPQNVTKLRVLKPAEFQGQEK